MERNAAKQFKNATEKAFTTQPNVKLNASTMADASKMMQSFKEETKEDSAKKSAKKQFSQDLQSDKDYIEFKRRAKFKDRGTELTFGTPNVITDDPYINKRKWSRVGKGETKEDKAPSKHDDLIKYIHNKMTRTKGKEYAPDVHELQKWIDEYYSNNPKKVENSEATGSGSSGAFSGPIAFKDSDFLRKSFSETPKIKEEVDKVEAKEATGSGSVGGYSSPSMWAKSTKKKDWGPSRKSQIPGGSFVKVKKKCTKFPYCNQGDINALTITKNESVKEAIKSVSKKFKISENVIISILEHEYEKINKRVK